MTWDLEDSVVDLHGVLSVRGSEILESEGVLSFPQVSNGRTVLAELQQYVSGCLHSGELRLGFSLTSFHCDLESSFLVRRHRKEFRD